LTKKEKEVQFIGKS